jgi:hypothetical protein
MNGSWRYSLKSALNGTSHTGRFTSGKDAPCTNLIGASLVLGRGGEEELPTRVDIRQDIHLVHSLLTVVKLRCGKYTNWNFPNIFKP